MRSVVVVGNPKADSRTRHAAELVVRRLTGEDPATTIELSALAPGLLTRGDSDVATAKVSALDAELLVIASPTYKATYTALLKLFLEQFDAGEIRDVPTVALMLGAGPAHHLSVQHTLVPVLVEIGCSCPAPGLYLLDSDYEGSGALDSWIDRAKRSFRWGVADTLETRDGSRS